MQVDYKSPGAIALGVALVAGLMVLSTGPGYRVGLFPLAAAFMVLRWGAYVGLAALAIAVVALVMRRGTAFAVPALLIGLLAFGIPFWFQRTAAGAPPIHDITTDTENPPQFVAIVPLRAGAPNTLEYSPETARLQRQAYRDLEPLLMNVQPSQAFGHALQAAKDIGWEVVAADPEAGRIEAIDTTPWFGFTDDIVVRLTPAAERTVVDVRSVSRVGRGDAGTNARRIREYLAALSR